MPFVAVPGLKGRVYVPQESREITKKHPCKDCFACQHCSDDRCRVCLQGKQGCCTDRIDIIEEKPALSPNAANCACGILE